MPDENQPDLINQEQQAPHDLLDPSYAQFRDQTRFWIQRVAVPLIMVVGLFGNLVTVIIMTRRRMRSTTNLYLAALALVDMLYLVLTFLLGLSHYPNMVGKAYYSYWQLRPFLMMLTDACSNTSVWLTVTFTIERFIAVKYPMRGKVWCTEARAKKLIVFVFVFGILFASPVPFEWEVVERRVKIEQIKLIESVNRTNFASSEPDMSSLGIVDSSNGDSDDNSQFPANARQLKELQVKDANQQEQQDDRRESADDTAYTLSLENTDFGRNETYKTIYYWSTAVIFYFIPLLSLTFFNGFLILSVHRSFRERKRMTGGQQTQPRGQCNNQHHNHHNQNQQLPLRDSRPRKEHLNFKNNRLAIPKIAIASRQSSELDGRHDEDDDDGHFIVVGVRSNERISCNGASCESAELEQHAQQPDTCRPVVEAIKPGSDTCQRGLISRSDLGVPSTDKIGQTGHHRQPNGRTVIGQQREINGAFSCATMTASSAAAPDITSRVHTDRRVEFNCDTDNVDGDDGTLDVQTNCDKTNNFNGTDGRARMNAGGELKSAIVVPILRMNYETAPTNASPSNIARQINQLADDDDHDVEDTTVGGKGSIKQRAPELDAKTDNMTSTVVTTTSGLREEVQHSWSVSDLQTSETAPTTATTTTTTTDNGTAAINNNSHHVPSTECASYISGKFHMIHPTVSGGGGSGLNPNSNYDSGSCTTIQTNASMVPASTQERRITIMLIAVVILFLCCQIPSAAMLLYTSVREPTPNTNEHALVLAFGNIFNFLMAVNAAGNFILYSFLSKKYRKTFMILFCDCFKRRRPDSEERLRPSGFLSTSSGGLNDENLSKLNGQSRSGRWTNAKFVRSKFSSTRQTTLQSDDLGNYLVGGSFVRQQQRRDTLV